MEIKNREVQFMPLTDGVEIPKLSELINHDIYRKYIELLESLGLNPDDYEPDISLPIGYNHSDFENNTFTISIGIKPKRQIQGINIDKLTFED